RASRSALVKAGWIVASAVDGAAVVIGHLPGGLRPGGLGQLRVPAIERKLKRRLRPPVTPCHGPSGTGAMPTTGNTLQTADSVVSAGPMARSTGATPIAPLWRTVLLRWPLDRSGIPAQFPRDFALSVLRGDGWLCRGCAAGLGWPGRSGLLLSAFRVPWMAGLAGGFGQKNVKAST